MSDIAPQTNRPKTVDDLRYQFKLSPVRIMDRPDFNEDRDIARWWGTTLAAAMEVPTLTVDEAGNIIRPKMDDEQHDLLIEDQKRYDTGRAAYQKYLTDGEFPDWGHEWSLYLDYEKIVTPKREEDSADE